MSPFMKPLIALMSVLTRFRNRSTEVQAKPVHTPDHELLEKTEVLARTVISQQSFYKSADCSEKQKQLFETMVGAAIWYLPQGNELWTGFISKEALEQLAKADNPKGVRLTKDHHYPRKVAAKELFEENWAQISDPSAEILERYLKKYGCFNYVLPEENKRLVKYQRSHCFVSPKASYEQAGIGLKKLSLENLKAIQKGDRKLALLLLSDPEES